ncbi:MAG: Rab family GTPase [Candidatus Hodarchaeales archaeon]|jgi:small GTP-binding protein
MTSEQVTGTNVLKIIILGEGGVGKTSLCKTYDRQANFLDTSLTIAVEFHVIRKILQGEEYTLQIWDLGGQEQFKNMDVFNKYCQGVSGAVVCFDLTDIITLNTIPRWFSFITENIPVILVGTKADLASSDELVNEEVQHLMNTHGFINYSETSALDVSSVERVFSILLAEIVKRSAIQPVVDILVTSN